MVGLVCLKEHRKLGEESDSEYSRAGKEGRENEDGIDQTIIRRMKEKKPRSKWFRLRTQESIAATQQIKPPAHYTQMNRCGLAPIKL